jgi:hypothetical protein
MSLCSDSYKALQDAKYFMITCGDDQAISILDGWLEDWLYRKEACPCCGTFNEDDSHD